MAGRLGRAVFVFLLGIVSFTCEQALADWDFTLSGANPLFYYGQYMQLGQRGFFGSYDVDNSATGNFAPLNSWVGNRTDVNSLTAGTNAATSSFGLQTNAHLKGDWVQAKGKYYINTYTTATTQGAYVAVSPGQLSTWSVSADLPIFKIAYGKQDFNKGMLLQFGSARTKEYFLLERGYEVPDILGILVSRGWVPAAVMGYFDRGREWQVSTAPEADADKNPVESDIAQNKEDYKEYLPETPGPWSSTRFIRRTCYQPGHVIIGLGFMPWEKIQIGTNPGPAQVSWNLNDVNAASFENFIGYLIYASADMEMGIGTLRICTHQGPELQQTALRRINTPTKETYTTEGWLYIKYSNGRYFLNAELDWFNRTWRFQRSQTGFFSDPDDLSPLAPLLPEFKTDAGSDLSGASRFAPQYWESWRFMVEGGMYYCASSLRLFYAYLPGQDRRHGVVIDRQPFIQEVQQQATGLLDPYSILQSYLFGGGVNAQSYINDASVYAIKFDYMIAANLATECSLLYAKRTSDGYGIGYIRPNPAQFGSVDYAVRGNFLNPAPSIPDKDLGWELMAGMIWKLVEMPTQNWTVAARVSSWWPGKWFNYACIDRAVPLWEVPGPGNNWGVNPNRAIDPILGFEVQVSAQY
jgi:hypothetical protein